MAEDRLRCPLYFKTRVCRHGIHCRYHHKRPTISRTLLLSNMYQHPDMITPGIDAQDNPIDPGQIQEHFENFYEDIFKMLSKYGEIKYLNVCDNLAKHMIGNVYVQFCHERQAQAALRDLQWRLYNWQPIKVEYSPSTVTKFFYSTCLLFEQNSCERGSYCNFLHVKIGHKLMRKLFGRSWRSRYSRSQSRNPSYRRDRESRKRSHERGDHREHERTYERRSRMSRYSRSRSPSFRRDRESRVRSHERGDHSDRDQKRHERRYERRSRRSRYSRSWSRSRSPSYRRDRESKEKSHERGDHRERDWIRHERRYERMSRRSRNSQSGNLSYRRDIRESRERPHERGDHRRSRERDRDRKRHEKRSERR